MKRPDLAQLNRSLTSPRTWRIRTRRLFLLGLPLALPLWVAGLAALMLLNALRAFCRPLGTFWNAPPKRHPRYYGRRYTREQTGRALIVLPQRGRRARR